jgi:hypothetical protein
MYSRKLIKLIICHSTIIINIVSLPCKIKTGGSGKKMAFHISWQPFPRIGCNWYFCTRFANDTLFASHPLPVWP